MELPIFRRAESALKEISGDSEARELARLREGARVHLSTALEGAEEFGRKEGRAEGLQLGLEKGAQARARSIAKSLISEGIADDKICQIKGLELSEVLKLKKES